MTHPSPENPPSSSEPSAEIAIELQTAELVAEFSPENPPDMPVTALAIATPDKERLEDFFFGFGTPINAFPRASFYAASGGAVAAMALGVWSIAGAFITHYSWINSVMGITLGLWGLQSPKRRLAASGCILCCLAILICFANGFGVRSLFDSVEPFAPVVSPDELVPPDGGE